MKLGRIFLESLLEAGGKIEITDDFFVNFNESFQKDPDAKDLIADMKKPANIRSREEYADKLKKLISEKLIDAVFVKLFGEPFKGELSYKTKPGLDTVRVTSSDKRIDAIIAARLKDPDKGPRPFKVLPEYTTIEYKLNPDDEDMVYLWAPKDSAFKSQQYYSTIKRDVDRDSEIYAYNMRKPRKKKGQEEEEGEPELEPYRRRRYGVAGEKELKARPTSAAASKSNKNLLRTAAASVPAKIQAFIDAYNKEEIDDPIWGRLLNPYIKPVSRVDPDDEESQKERVSDLLQQLAQWALEKEFITNSEADPSREKIEIKGAPQGDRINVIATQGPVKIDTMLDVKTHKIDPGRTKIWVQGIQILGN